MPENVTRFQPIENVKKPLIRWTYIDIMPSRLPTFFHEEPFKKEQRCFATKSHKSSSKNII